MEEEFTKCRSCGSKISAKTRVCPCCGAYTINEDEKNEKLKKPIQSPSMTLILLIILLLLLPPVRNFIGVCFSTINTTIQTITLPDFNKKTNAKKAPMPLMSKDLNNYLRKNKYHRLPAKGRKLVIYSISINSAISKYKMSPMWRERYSFTEYLPQQTNNPNFKSIKQAREINEFNKACSKFCIIDFSDKTYFAGKSTDKKYLYRVFATFYN